MWIRTLIVAALAATATPAIAADWWLIAESGERPARNFFFADRDSVRRTGPNQVEVQGRFYQEAPADNIAARSTLFRLSCDGRTSLILTGDSRDRSGAVVERFDFADVPQEPNPIVPGSAFESLLEFSCDGAQGVSQAGADPDALVRRLFD